MQLNSGGPADLNRFGKDSNSMPHVPSKTLPESGYRAGILTNSPKTIKRNIPTKPSVSIKKKIKIS